MRRPTYKEKYFAMQEKHTQVSETREAYRKELALAEDKLRKLQDECNLLLDAVDIAAPAQPSLLHYLARDPIPPQYHSYQVPFPSTAEPTHAPVPAQQSSPGPTPPTPAHPHSQPHSHGHRHRSRSNRKSATQNGNGVSARR
ncbi:hypothetical protein DAEQUDRAFT_727543 [Daedalea quercina L-15889]|uniref:Uncharacterized protein n=1 Tax=Daedalea quercina L-15889 TaxID=1314783 RepID=A0A165PVE1_9APHY|nr:hypothetical protein DAEQUDRAFT_727543 [Daedalea quercina L-15889]